jgi:hypothetical protein
MSCRGGYFSTTTSAVDLRRRFGRDNVITSALDIGEGQHERGTTLFPGDSSRRIEIRWRDTVAQRRPAMVTVTGSFSHWHLPNGIQLGTSNRDLERMNGRPFSVAGFGFDGAGVVLDWRGGRLEFLRQGDCRIAIRLEPGTINGATRRSYAQASGDHEFRSSDAAMRSLNLRVVEIALNYPP